MISPQTAFYLIYGLGIGLFISLALFFMSFIKWNGRKFFMKNLLVIQTSADRKVKLLPAKKSGALAETNEGFFLINPDHVYIDYSSRTPIAFVYGENALATDPKVIPLIKELKKLGIHNYVDLKEYIDKNKLVKYINETIPISEVENYIASSWNPRHIEAEIQHRISAEKTKNANPMTSNFFKIMLGLGIFVVLVAIAVLVIQSQTGDSSSSAISTSQFNQMLDALKSVDTNIQTNPNVIQ